MRKLDRLKAEARQAATWRRHTLARFHAMHSRTHTAMCTLCGASAYINIKPLPNEIDVSGEAVALNCRGSQ